jgi:hypothetical protein
VKRTGGEKTFFPQIGHPISESKHSGFIGKSFNIAVKLSIQFMDTKGYQTWNIFFSLPKGMKVNSGDIEPIVQIFPEGVFSDQLLSLSAVSLTDTCMYDFERRWKMKEGFDAESPNRKSPFLLGDRHAKFEAFIHWVSSKWKLNAYRMMF